MKNLILIFMLLFFNTEKGYKEYFNFGLEKFQDKDYKMALENFFSAYELNNHSRISYYISITYFELRNYENAFMYAKRTLKELPKITDEKKLENLKYIIEIIRNEENDKEIISVKDETFQAKATPQALSMQKKENAKITLEAQNIRKKENTKTTPEAASMRKKENTKTTELQIQWNKGYSQSKHIALPTQGVPGSGSGGKDIKVDNKKVNFKYNLKQGLPNIILPLKDTL